jgi:hypothetical protein
MSDTYARVMEPGDEPGNRRTARSGAARRSGTASPPKAGSAPLAATGTPLAATGAPLAAATGPPARSAASPAEATFAAAVAAFQQGRSGQTHRDLSFEDVPAPKRLAPYATAIAAAVQRDGADIAWGRLVLLYDPDGQEGWNGVFRLVAYVRAEVEPEIAADPLLGEVGWSWLSEALDQRVPGYAQPSGTVTRVITEGFGAKRDELPLTGFELRASWSPAAPGGPGGTASRAGRRRSGRAAGADGPGETDLSVLDLPAHIAAWCDCLSAAAGLEPPGTRALRPPG